MTEKIQIAPVVRDDAHAARIEACAKALDAARGAVADAALEWDSYCDLRHDAFDAESSELREALREALATWRQASEAFLRAVSGRS